MDRSYFHQLVVPDSLFSFHNTFINTLIFFVQTSLFQMLIDIFIVNYLVLFILVLIFFNILMYLIKKLTSTNSTIIVIKIFI